MQINGAQLSAVIYPKAFEFQEQTRTPVVIDVKPTVEPSEKISSQAFSDPSLSQQLITTYESQQARFVRLLATTEQPSTHIGVTVESTSMPRSVQHYLQVADVRSEQSQRLFDEIV